MARVVVPYLIDVARPRKVSTHSLDVALTQLGGLSVTDAASLAVRRPLGSEDYRVVVDSLDTFSIRDLHSEVKTKFWILPKMFFEGAGSLLGAATSR